MSSHPFTGEQLNALQNAVGVMYNHCAALTPSPHLAYDRMLSVFAEPAHAKALLAANQFARPSRDHFEVIVDGLRVDVYSIGGFLLPSKPISQLDSEPYQLVREWVVARDKLKRDFGRVLALVPALYENCTNAKQVRYVFPGILALAKLGGLDEFARSIAELVPPRTRPTLSPDIRAACRLASETVAVGQLLAESKPARPLADREFNLVVVNRSFSEGGFGFESIS